MDAVLRDYLGKICYCYIDDIVIYSTTREEPVRHVEMVLKRLQQHGLKLNRKKCHFGCEEVGLYHQC